MAQHDYDIANDTAANVRADINDVLAAIVSNNSGTSEPSTTYANQWWYDSDNDILKIRNEADTAWIEVGYVDQLNGLFKSGYENEPTVYTTSGTYTPTAGARYALIKMKGAGASGAGSSAPDDSNKTSFGGGGGEGGYIGGIIDLSTITSATITIGAGGAGAASSVGSAGGDTVWNDGTNTWTAEGGLTANVGNNINNTGRAAGGQGGGTSITGATPYLTRNGAAGGNGSGVGGGTTPFPSAIGGEGGNGPAPSSQTTTNNRTAAGVNATTPGTGGSGASQVGNQSSGIAGGDGADGEIIVWEFF